MGTCQRVLFLLAAVLVAMSLVSQPAGAVSSGERAAETYLLVLVNRDRSAAHIGALNEQSYVRGQAEAHSSDMLNRHTMDHNGFTQRVANIRANVPGMKYSGICENVAAATNYSDSGTAMRAINSGWLASSEHHKCMLDQLGWTAQSVGIGVRFDGRTYWVTMDMGHNTSP
jgi:uncharacterized protein YkwD